MATPGIRRRDLKVSGWSAAGGATAAGAAFLTWLCCIPLGAGAVGAGLAAVGNLGFGLRPYLNGLAVLLLGFAFYRAFRRVPCDEGSCATPRQRRRVGVLLWSLALVTGLLLSSPLWSDRLIYLFY